MAKEFLSQKGVPYQEKDVSRDRAAAQEMVRRSGQQGVPVITVGDEVIVGFDRPRLEQALAWRGNGGAAPHQSAGSTAQRPRFGAAVADAESSLARRGQPPQPGAYVGRVRPETPAARTGLQPGDVVAEVNGRPILSAAEFESLIGRARPGDQVALTVVRDGRTLRLGTTL